MTVVVVVSGFFFINLGISYWRRHRRRKVEIYELHNVDDQKTALLPADFGKSGEIWQVSYDELKFGKKLGDGANGEVFTAQWDGTLVAVKVLPSHSLVIESKGDLDSSELPELDSEFTKEVKTLAALRHPNLVSYFGFGVRPGHAGLLVKPAPFLVMELMRGGTLRELLQSNTMLAPGSTVEYSIGVAAGMKYLHSCNPPVVHRDLKSDNILLDGSDRGRGSVKISDFGTATKLDKSPGGCTASTRSKRNAAITKTIGVGTPLWMAPEVFNGKYGFARYGTKVDVYSFGIVLFELITRKDPFSDQEDLSLIEFQTLVSEGLRPVVPDGCDIPDGFEMLMKRCWDGTPDKRPSFTEIAAELQAIYCRCES